MTWGDLWCHWQWRHTWFVRFPSVKLKIKSADLAFFEWMNPSFQAFFLTNLASLRSCHRRDRVMSISVTRPPCMQEISSELARLTPDTNLRERKKKKPRRARVRDNLSPPEGGAGDGSILPPSHSSPGPAPQRDMILKHFLIKIERRTLSFLCLQAVNYLTSTHNEQCKTSQNLIKRQRRGPSADGKWLTQLIKHPSVGLNMASPSHHLRKRWELSALPFFHFL